MSLLFFFSFFFLLSFLATTTYLLSIHIFDTGMTTVQKVWGNDIRDRLCSSYPQKIFFWIFYEYVMKSLVYFAWRWWSSLQQGGAGRIDWGFILCTIHECCLADTAERTPVCTVIHRLQPLVIGGENINQTNKYETVARWLGAPPPRPQAII